MGACIQTDWTNANEHEVTIAGEAFAHLPCACVPALSGDLRRALIGSEPTKIPNLRISRLRKLRQPVDGQVVRHVIDYGEIERFNIGRSRSKCTQIAKRGIDSECATLA
jgi:hypothetical protein